MIHIVDKKDCCGCTACQSVCPRGAISMKPDSLGFLYPVVDKNKCTKCNLCSKVCSFNKAYKRNEANEIEVYAVRHKDIKEIENSRSGAMFIAITDHVIDNGGVVYGAGYRGHFIVTHKRAISKEERDDFRGSKYVQSDLNDTFKRIRNDLKAGLMVCFSGTPCQTAGLRSFLDTTRTDFTNLITIDIVCHGVPAPYIWRDYLDWTEKTHKGVADAISFRDKQEVGWTAHKESFIINGKKIFSSTYADLFFMHLMSRHSCNVCHYANTERPSDITIGDFWGWENIDTEFNKDDKGVSLVLLNSTKGKKLFDKVKHDIDYIKTELDLALQPNLQQPSTVSPQRMNFERDYKSKGFEYVMKKYNKKAHKSCKLKEILHKIKWNINHRLLKR